MNSQKLCFNSSSTASLYQTKNVFSIMNTHITENPQILLCYSNDVLVHVNINTPS